ncbi:MAG: YciI family protein [Pseudomonadota bacterium]
MPNFMLAYHGGKRPETQAEIDKTMAAWGAWMETHKAALVDPGNPVGMSKTVSSAGVADNGGPNPLAGYTILAADDIDAACKMAAANPIVAEGGSVEVAEIHVIEM